MILDKEIKTDVENIVSLISCAWDYGHTNGMIMDALFSLLDYNLTDEMIEEYAEKTVKLFGRRKPTEEEVKNYPEEDDIEYDPDYEDYFSIKKDLEGWAEKYNKKKS